MKEPIKWLEKALNSGKYEKDTVAKIKSCISEGEFDVNKFVAWVSEQLEKEQSED